MFKYLQTLSIAVLFGFRAYAQNDPQTLKIDTKASSVKAFRFDDHLNILTISKKQGGVDLLAVNEKMEVAWKKELSTPPVTINKFKNRVVMLTSDINDYHIVLFDAANGTQLIDKIVHPRAKVDFWEWQNLYTNNGSILKMAVGTTIVSKKPRTSIEGKDLTTLNGLEIIDLNEQLEVTGTTKFDVKNATLINIIFNQPGDMFVSWLNDGMLEIDKYDAGKNVLSGKLTAGVAPLKNRITTAADYIRIIPSATDVNSVYYGLTYENENNDIELGLGKFDFKTNKKLFNNLVIDKNYLKDVKKSFVPVNKKIDDVFLGYYKGYELRYLDDANGTIVAAMTSRSTENSQITSGLWFIESSVLVTGYDGNLSPKFQQFLPAHAEIPNIYLNTSYYRNKSKLYIIANNKQSFTRQPTYGVLDITAGQWDKMDYLSRKGVADSPYFDGKAILWYDNSFIIPYLSPEVTLQQHNY